MTRVSGTTSATLRLTALIVFFQISLGAHAVSAESPVASSTTPGAVAPAGEKLPTQAAAAPQGTAATKDLDEEIDEDLDAAASEEDNLEDTGDESDIESE